MGFWKKIMDPLSDNTPIVAWKINDNEQSFFFMGSWTRRILPRRTETIIYDKPKEIDYDEDFDDNTVD